MDIINPPKKKSTKNLKLGPTNNLNSILHDSKETDYDPKVSYYVFNLNYNLNPLIMFFIP